MTTSESPHGPTSTAEPTDPPASADRVGAARGWRAVWPVLIVFGLALLIRMVYLYEIRTIPFFEHPQVDARSYDQWAQRIAAGDWWGDEVFYQAPAYPYFLACVYRVAGHSLLAARLVQMVLGALSCALICLAGRHLFGPVAGVAAGVLLALYAPALFFDGLIQKAGVGLFLVALLMYLVARGQRCSTLWLWLAGGATTGLLALARENALLLIPVVAVWLAVRFRDQSGWRRARWVGGYLAGVALVLLPVAVRNYVIGGVFAPTTSQMGPNFYIGNNAQATGVYAPLVPGRQDPLVERSDAVELAERDLGRALTSAEVSDYWFGRGLQYVKNQPGAWLKLCGRKWSLVWNHFELPDAEDVYAYADWSPTLRGLLRILHFGVLVPLAVIGAALTWARRRDAWIVYAMVLVTAASVALFYVFARYRFPLVPMLMLLAGAACVEGYVLLRGGRFRRLLVPAVLGTIVAVLVNRSIVPEEQCRAISYVNLGSLCARMGREADAERFFSRSMEMAPDNPKASFGLGALRVRQGRLIEAEAHLRRAVVLAPFAAEVHAALADVQARLERIDQAVTHYQEAIRLRPTFVPARVKLAELWLQTASPERAVAELERVVALEPDNIEALTNLGMTLRSLGMKEEAERRFRQAVDLNPSVAQTLQAQGIELSPVVADVAPESDDAEAASGPEELIRQGGRAAELGRFVQAADLYRQALEFEPDNPLTHYRLGWALASVNRFEEATASYLRALELAPGFAEAHNQLGIAYGRLMKPGLAVKHFRLACEAKPDMLLAHNNLATALANLSRFDEAVEALERCEELAATSGRADLQERIAERLKYCRAQAAANRIRPPP